MPLHHFGLDVPKKGEVSLMKVDKYDLYFAIHHVDTIRFYNEPAEVVGAGVLGVVLTEAGIPLIRLQRVRVKQGHMTEVQQILVTVDQWRRSVLDSDEHLRILPANTALWAFDPGILGQGR